FVLHHGSLDVSIDNHHSLVITGSGEISHLGRATLSGEVPLGNPLAGGLYHVSGAVTFVAANGDILYTTFAGTVRPGFGAVTATEGTLTFNGGTGLIADAVGSAAWTSLSDPLTGVTTSSIEGWIDY